MAGAQATIDGASGTTLLEQALPCNYAFMRPPPSGPKKNRGQEGHSRSASPTKGLNLSFFVLYKMLFVRVTSAC